MKIPHVNSWLESTGVRAAFAGSLASIRPESSEYGPSAQAQQREIRINAHRRCASLMSLLARWRHPFSFELHIQTFPSLLPRHPGRTTVHFVWHVRARDLSGALELALADQVALYPLLEMCWPSCEWTEVGDWELQALFSPFQPHSSVCVCHRTEPISTSRPFLIDRPSIGFLPDPERAQKRLSGTALEHVYPWVPTFGEHLPNLLETLLSLPSPRWMIFRVGNDEDKTCSQRALSRLEHSIEESERFLAGLSSGQMTLTAQAQELRNANLGRYAQLTDGSLRGGVLLICPGEPDYVMANLLGQCITGDHARRDTERMLEGGFALRAFDPALVGSAFHFPDEEPWSAEEGAGVFRLPTGSLRGAVGLPVLRHRSVEYHPTSGLSSAGSLTLGINRHRGVSREIHIDVSERLHHCLCLGATGVGKSSFLLNCMLQDARNGVGFTLIDPPGELADDLLARFPKERASDLIVVDLEDRERPVPLNLLAWTEPDERDLIIDTLYNTLLNIYKAPDFFGPVFEQHFRSGLRLLMGDTPHTGEFVPTLIEFPQVIRNRNLRTFLKSFLDDREVGDAVEEGDKVSGENSLANVAPYVNAKFSRFLQDSMLRRIVGHGRMTFNFRDVMDSGKVVIFKLAQGRFGKSAAEILMAQIVARFRMAAMSRADVLASERRPHFLYVDECQVLADANIADMLSQCRKYSLGLVLANQFVGQLRSNGVLDAVLGNVGTIAAFRVSYEDAHLLEPVFVPAISAQDLVECPNWNGYMRISASRNQTRPFSFGTLPPDTTPPDPAWARALREESRNRWGVPREEIDAKIKARRKFIAGLAENGTRC